MANELTDLDLGEWSICIDPANEDCAIEIVKSKSGLSPVLKETTDMSDNNDDHIDNDEDEAFNEFAEEVLTEFSELGEDDQIEALVDMAARNVELEAAVEDATEVVKSLTENSVSKAKYDEVVAIVKKSGELIEKMKASGNAALDDGGLVAEIKKANGGADLSPEAVARIEAVEKAQAETAQKEAIAKAKTYGFGKAEDVAGLETRIRKALGGKDADAFVALVKQAGQLAKASPMFKPVGEDAGSLDANDPIAKANSEIAKIRKDNPNLTEAQAKAKYWDDNPAEYAAYRAAQRAA